MIDPAIYEAQLDQALAKKAQDEAQLADARREFDRNSKVGPIATLQKNVDTSRAKVAQFEALVKADQAAIDLARTQLELHPRRRADRRPHRHPHGRRRQRRARRPRPPAIVMITQVQPIAVLFNLPQQQLARINAAILRCRRRQGRARRRSAGARRQAP